MQNKVTDEYLSIAAKIFLFDGIPGNERLKNIYECSPCLRMFKSGELISSPNEYIGGLQIIVSGKAIVTAEFEKNSTILRMLAKGDVFGAPRFSALKTRIMSLTSELREKHLFYCSMLIRLSG